MYMYINVAYVDDENPNLEDISSLRMWCFNNWCCMHPIVSAIIYSKRYR